MKRQQRLLPLLLLLNREIRTVISNLLVDNQVDLVLILCGFYLAVLSE
jgi:hypothetical protein